MAEDVSLAATVDCTVVLTDPLGRYGELSIKPAHKCKTCIGNAGFAVKSRSRGLHSAGNSERY
jgi:hypothetical protein